MTPPPAAEVTKVDSRKRRDAPNDDDVPEVLPPPTKKVKKEVIKKSKPKAQSLRKVIAKRVAKRAAKAVRSPTISASPVAEGEVLYFGEGYDTDDDDEEDEEMEEFTGRQIQKSKKRVRGKKGVVQYDDFQGLYETDPLGEAFDDHMAKDTEILAEDNSPGNVTIKIEDNATKDVDIKVEDIVLEKNNGVQEESPAATTQHSDWPNRYIPVHAHVQYHGLVINNPGSGGVPPAFPTIPATSTSEERDMAANTIAVAYLRQIDHGHDHFSWWLNQADVLNILQQFGHGLSKTTIIKLQELLERLMELEKAERRRQALDPDGSLTIERGYSPERLEHDFGAGVFDPEYDYQEEDLLEEASDDEDEEPFVLYDEPIFSAVELGVLDRKGNVTIPKPGEKRHYGT